MEMIDRSVMGREVSESLWCIYHQRPGSAKLVLPRKRDGTRRVSEQESKILIAQWLENHGYCYSIETPTTQQYQQSGSTALSARTDITMYGGADDSARVVNIELKAGTPDVEAFRKDFEKLLREQIDGFWFHTLERASPDTWDSIQTKMSESFRKERTNIAKSKQTIVFGFCVLEAPQYTSFVLDFSHDLNQQWPACFQKALERSEHPTWGSEIVIAFDRPQRFIRRSYQGGTQKLMVYCPDIYSESFVHLSIRGESYAIRAFSGSRKFEKWKQPDVSTTSELLDRFQFAYRIDVSGERKNVGSEKQYWVSRTTELNRLHSILPKK